MMSGASRDIVTHNNQNDSGPDYLGYYKAVVLDLFSQNENFLLPFSGLNLESSTGECSRGEVNRCSDSGPLFSGGVVADLSDFKRERLKAILSQSVVDLNQETDEILDRILAVLRIEADLREKELSPCSSSASDEETTETLCSKKQKLWPSLISTNFDKHIDTHQSQSLRKAYDGFQVFIDNCGLQPEEAVDRCFDDIYAKLRKMDQNLEDYLDIVVSKCRPMTLSEKQQLGQQVQNLPNKAFDRVVEIIDRKNSSGDLFPDRIHVNLEKENNVTLWRLHHYVKLVAEANKLSS